MAAFCFCFGTELHRVHSCGAHMMNNLKQDQCNGMAWCSPDKRIAAVHLAACVCVTFFSSCWETFQWNNSILEWQCSSTSDPRNVYRLWHMLLDDSQIFSFRECAWFVSEWVTLRFHGYRLSMMKRAIIIIIIIIICKETGIIGQKTLLWTCSKISRNKSRRQGNHTLEPTSTNLQKYPQQQTRQNPWWWKGNKYVNRHCNLRRQKCD